MKKFTILAFACIASLASGSAFAAGDQCQGLEDAARPVMSARQAGVPLSKVLEVSESDKNSDVRKLTRLIALEAYGKPRFETEEYQARATADFADEIRLICETSASRL